MTEQRIIEFLLAHWRVLAPVVTVLVVLFFTAPDALTFVVEAIASLIWTVFKTIFTIFGWFFGFRKVRAKMGE